jgi:hypothetical protein
MSQGPSQSIMAVEPDLLAHADVADLAKQSPNIAVDSHLSELAKTKLAKAELSEVLSVCLEAGVLEAADALRAEARALEAGDLADDGERRLDLRHLENAAAEAAGRHDRRAKGLPLNADVAPGLPVDPDELVAINSNGIARRSSLDSDEAQVVPLNALVAIDAFVSVDALVAVVPLNSHVSLIAEQAADGDVGVERSEGHRRPKAGNGRAGRERWRRNAGGGGPSNHNGDRTNGEYANRGGQSPGCRFKHDLSSQRECYTIF